MHERYGFEAFSYGRCVYDMLEEYCTSYTVESWQGYLLSNGGFYNSLRSRERTLRVVNRETEIDEDLSPDTLSIIFDLYAFKFLSESVSAENIREQFRRDHHSLFEHMTRCDDEAVIRRFFKERR